MYSLGCMNAKKSTKVVKLRADAADLESISSALPGLSWVERFRVLRWIIKPCPVGELIAAAVPADLKRPRRLNPLTCYALRVGADDVRSIRGALPGFRWADVMSLAAALLTGDAGRLSSSTAPVYAYLRGLK